MRSFLGVMVAALLLAGCGGRGAMVRGGPPAFLGTWSRMAGPFTDSMELRADGSMVSGVGGMSTQSTWAEQGGVLTVKSPSLNLTERFRWVVSQDGRQLTLTTLDAQDRGTTIVTYQRQ